MEDVTLYACKNCLTETEYRGYDKRSSAQAKNKHVESFVQEFLNEHEGTFTTWKFYRAQQTDQNVFLISTLDFPELSRSLRESVSWKCSKCKVNMVNKTRSPCSS